MDPSAQLESELKHEILKALDTRRPILTHVNADTTWLVQLPCPPSHPSPSGRLFFNLLVDPWLVGPQSDVAAWFSTQWHSIPSSISSISEMEERLREIEELAREGLGLPGNVGMRQQGGSSSCIDAVLISHEFTDHCHQTTLLEIDPAVPIFANDKAASLVKSFNHFKNIFVVPAFKPADTDWRKTSLPPLPEWIGVSRITSPGNALYYHAALLIVADYGSETGAEAIIYTPHGITAEDLDHVAKAEPPLHTLALIHGLHDVGVTHRFQMNRGAHNGLKAERITRPRYWVGSHDEEKRGGGFISFLLRREVLTLQEALDRERAEAGPDADPKGLRGVNYSEIMSGESLLLI